MLDFFVGIKGPDFLMLCSDCTAVQQIITIKDTEDKLIPIDSHKCFAMSGETADRVNFSEYIIANVRLYELRNSVHLSTKAVAHLTRNELAGALRKKPYFVNLLLAGFDEGEEGGPSLYQMDYLASQHKVNIGGTGHGSKFVLALFDKMWRPDLTQEEAVTMMEKGVAEVRKRLVIAPPAFNIKVVDKEGIRLVTTL